MKCNNQLSSEKSIGNRKKKVQETGTFQMSQSKSFRAWDWIYDRFHVLAIKIFRTEEISRIKNCSPIKLTGNFNHRCNRELGVIVRADLSINVEER